MNDERTQCIKDPCEKITLNEVSITEIGNKTLNVEPNNVYIFKIDNDNENISYTFNSDTYPLFYTYDNENTLRPITKSSTFIKGDKIYCNFFVNNTENISINISSHKNKNNNKNDDNGDDDGDDDKDDIKNSTNNYYFSIPKKKRGLSAGTIIAIIASILVALIIVFITIIICNKNSNFQENLSNGNNIISINKNI